MRYDNVFIFFMSQLELFGIDNPCVGICQMNKKGYCIGCLRNRTERQAWHTLGDDDKHKILNKIIKRRRKLIDTHYQKQRPWRDNLGQTNPFVF